MMTRKSASFAALCAAGLVAAGTAWFANEEAPQAADHTDPPAAFPAAGDAADIGDLYAWHDANATTLTVVLTFAGPLPPVADQTGTYDADVLYGIHIDNNDDDIANHDIWVRFAQNDLGEWGLQATGLPGEAGPVEGAVETELSGTSARIWAGLRDDPFFFDLEGFQDTLSTGALAFDPTRDSFAGANVTAIVLEVPVSAAMGGNTDPLQIWATTGEI